MIFDRLKAIDSLGRGEVQNAVVLPASNKFDSWLLLLIDVNGKRHTVTRARKSVIKIYKSLDSALTDARVMGFKTINVELEPEKGAA